jgi:hypothetical protein
MIEETRWSFGTNDDPKSQRLMPLGVQLEIPLDVACRQHAASDKLEWEFQPHEIQTENPAQQLDRGQLTLWLSAAGIMLAVVWVLI